MGECETGFCIVQAKNEKEGKLNALADIRKKNAPWRLICV